MNKKSYSKEVLSQLNTPCYIIDKEVFENNIKIIKEAFMDYWGENLILGYSVKTNHWKDFLKIAKNNGLLAETVSDDEYKMVQKLTYENEKIIYNGPQKSEKQMIYALNHGSIVNLDNPEDIYFLEKNRHRIIGDKVRIGIRVNFNLEKKCPGQTTAGEEVSRFGFCLENGELKAAIEKLRNLKFNISGLHMHYSTKSRSTQIFKELAEVAGKLVQEYKLESELYYIDIGGGFFGGQVIAGKPTMEEYAKTITGELKKWVDTRKVTLILEPGASILATSVVYITKVINVRNIRGTYIQTVDGSLLHINPFQVKRNPECEIITDSIETVDRQIICGSTCMESDRIFRLEHNTKVEKNDYVCCHFSGAYTMGFNNCFINLPPYIYIYEDNQYSLCRDKNEALLQEI